MRQGDNSAIPAARGPPKRQIQAIRQHQQRKEGDLITGASNRTAIGTLAERKARYVLLVHLPDNHTADATSAGVARAMSPLPAGLRRTLTWDQGSEMAGHVQLAADLGTSIYSCEAHSPWHRPTNENMNGLLRDYFPKGTDLAAHSAEPRHIHVGRRKTSVMSRSV